MPQGWAQLLIDALQFVNQFSRAFAKKQAPRMIAPKRLGLATCSKSQTPNAHKKSHIQPQAAKTVGFAVTYVAQRCLADPMFRRRSQSNCFQNRLRTAVLLTAFD
jgi:hypothetical protein